MSARRSTRERRKPKAIYEVEDRRRDTDEETEGDGEEQEKEEEEEAEEEEDGEEEEDQEEEEADRSKAPQKKRTRQMKPPKAARQTGGRPRKLKPVPEEGSRPRKKKQLSSGANGDGGAEGGDAEEEDEDALFEAIKRGKCSITDLVAEWREQYEEDADQAMREVLNFVLQACGGIGQCVPPTESLEKLDMGDLVDYVVDDLEKTNDGYPIASRAKAFKKFHQNYVDFWDAFVSECYECELLFTTDIADHFVDWLTSLSSAEVRAIRHTTTVAAYAVGSGIVRCVAKLGQHLSVIQRQLNAEATTKKTSRKGEASKKLAHLKESKLMYEERQSRLLEFVQLLFNGVVVHRYRDVMPEVRVESVQVLGDWIHTLPEHFLKDNYLKYLGWVLNDKESQVRLRVVEILQHLYENEEFAEKMELFTSRFLPRFLELCNDVDDLVVEACIKLLVAVDKRSLISSDVELQSVERLVFDENNEVIRKAAAEFVCLQYDAFGVAESKRSAKLTREQLNTQAIALVEFAEEYVTNHGVPAEAVETMVDAFWGLDDCQVLQDWKLLTSLLLADKNAPDLTSDQQTLLIRLLVASIGKIAMIDNDKSGASAKKKSHKERDEMCVMFCKEIPNMLVRFQADVEKLALLVELIPLLALKGEVNGLQAVHVKSLLEKLEHAYTTNTEVGLLKSLALSIHHLRRSEHELIKRESDITIHQMVQDILDKVDESLEEDGKLFLDLQENPKSGRSKRRVSKKRDLSDSEYAVRTALTRLNCLITHVCIRDFVPQGNSQAAPSPGNKRTVRDSVSGVSTRMESVLQALADFVSRRSKKVTELNTSLLEPETVKLAVNIMLVDLLWLAHPVFASISGSDTNENIWTELEPQVDKICASRSLFEGMIISILEMHLNKVNKQRDDEPAEEGVVEEPHVEMEELVFEDPRVQLYVKEAQRAAFMAFCDARCLFVEQFKEAPSPVDRLNWSLPKVLVLLTQMYFENEMEPSEDDSEPDEEVAAALDATKTVVLLALGRVSHSNPSNKRQAAAVLRFLVDGGTQSQEIVRAFSKQIKAEAPVRYLEVQMTALRQVFSTIVSMKEEWQSCEDDESAREEIEKHVLTSEVELKELAKKLSQSLGVGKITSSLRAPFFRFLCEGVRFSLEQVDQFSFLEALRPYLSHLDKASTKQLHSYFSQLLENLGDDVPVDAESSDEEWKIVFEFQSLISDPDGIVKTGSTSAKILKRKAKTSVGIARATEEMDEDAVIEGARNGDNEEDEDIASNENQTPNKRLKAAKKRDIGEAVSATPSADSSTGGVRNVKSKRKLPLSDAEDTPQKRLRSSTRRSSGRITQLSDDEDGEEVPSQEVSVENDADMDTEEPNPHQNEEEDVVSRRGRRSSRARK